MGDAGEVIGERPQQKPRPLSKSCLPRTRPQTTAKDPDGDSGEVISERQ